MGAWRIVRARGPASAHAPDLFAPIGDQGADEGVGGKGGAHDDDEDPPARQARDAHRVGLELECVVAVVGGVLVHLVKVCKPRRRRVAEKLHVRHAREWLPGGGVVIARVGLQGRGGGGGAIGMRCTPRQLMSATSPRAPLPCPTSLCLTSVEVGVSP